MPEQLTPQRRQREDVRPWPPLMSTRTWAAYWDVSERLVQKWIAMGKINPVPMPGGERLARFQKADIDALIGLPTDD